MNRLLRDSARVLAIGAHPDDVEVGAGGLLARLSAEGADVTIAIVSVPSQPDQRCAEARNAAVVIDAELMILHDAPCRVEDIPMHELVRRFDHVIGDLRPDLVITHSANDLHWDHGLVHRATISALRRTPCDLLAFLSSPEMNAQARAMGNCFADITAYMDRKLEAIACHTSQLPRLDLESSRDLARAMGRISGARYAEVYEVLRMQI